MDRIYDNSSMNDMESDPSSDEEEMMMELDHYFKSPQVKDVNSVLRSSSCNQKKMATELNQQDRQSQFRLLEMKNLFKTACNQTGLNWLQPVYGTP